MLSVRTTVSTSVRLSPLFKIKQISSENNVHYWRDCGSGRVDHWWHLSFLFCFAWFKKEATHVRTYGQYLNIVITTGRVGRPSGSIFFFERIWKFVFGLECLSLLKNLVLVYDNLVWHCLPLNSLYVRPSECRRSYSRSKRIFWLFTTKSTHKSEAATAVWVELQGHLNVSWKSYLRINMLKNVSYLIVIFLWKWHSNQHSRYCKNSIETELSCSFTFGELECIWNSTNRCGHRIIEFRETPWPT